MNLIFKSTNMKDLTDIAVDFQKYIKQNNQVSSKDIYLRNLVSKIITKHRKLPINIGHEFKSSNITDICGFCCKSINKNIILRKLPCGHEYHKKCIDNWLISNELRCPHCQKCCLMSNI